MRASDQLNRMERVYGDDRSTGGNLFLQVQGDAQILLQTFSLEELRALAAPTKTLAPAGGDSAPAP